MNEITKSFKNEWQHTSARVQLRSQMLSNDDVVIEGGVEKLQSSLPLNLGIREIEPLQTTNEFEMIASHSSRTAIAVHEDRSDGNVCLCRPIKFVSSSPFLRNPFTFAAIVIFSSNSEAPTKVGSPACKLHSKSPAVSLCRQC